MMRLLLLLLAMLSAGQLHAQRPTSPPVVFMPDSLIRDSLRYEFPRLREVAYRRGLTRLLYRMVFVRANNGDIEILEAENSEKRFKPYEGRQIREIRVRVLPPFGTSIRDTSYARDSAQWFEVMANSIHQRSSERLVKNHLTVKTGDRIIPFELVQNELLLKELSNIDDAMIRVEEIKGDTTAVDLHVMCRDEFSWTGSGSTNFRYNASIGIENHNLWGIGHLAGYEASYQGHRDQRWGHKAMYSIRNLFSSRLNFHGNFMDVHDNHLFTLGLEREFLTAQTKWAGGAFFGRVYSSTMLKDKEIVEPVERFNYHLVDVWSGYSRQWPQRYTFNQNIYFTARYTGLHFVNRPLVRFDSNYMYYNRDTYIGAFSYVKLKYFKANLIYDFGRTEEIPSGLYGSFLLGYEKHDFDDLVYMGAEWVYSWYNVRSGRFYSLAAALGSFLNAREVESGTFRVEGNYISPLYPLRRNRVRLYGRVGYMLGIRRAPGDYIYFRENEDIHGFRSKILRGDHRLSASFSSTIFLSRIKWGFRTSISSYTDVGFLTGGKEALLKSKPYWGIGASLNLRNENLIFKNLSIRFTFYPNIVKDVRHFSVDAHTYRERGFYDFKVRAPEPVRYE
ncbi:MAG: hypothetical protein LBI96_03420 [Odoribacteraceae bacterium]|jgi:hypothetical protein|nr:hypothetical protein [Odoribacteraceae bacterium]